ncbi:hypothetical protein AYO21_05701 [Fonsecaea monophora]|uniref:Uncharacterized protein n=1 Tax=Fonsecaea monophora TaxID=254056 RepID=A0A177F8V0_9EURO|nr:hypothetical protein AYO21_05701 [Fonsecaea monophora]KAH0829294.1 hypothetical protein FOPE_10876 [Fonsecaea pedrosoi]OAG40020.1 hypothetical protein AYO21_05701 [Fonsecaea monophora]
MTTKVFPRAPNPSPNGRGVFTFRSNVQSVDKAPADAAAILSSINEKQTDDGYKLEGIILYICDNFRKCRGLWAVSWVEKPKCPTMIRVSKYKELAMTKVCADCELAEWELVDKAEG